MKKLFTCLMLMVGMLLPLTATAADLKADLTIYYDVSTFGDFSGKKLQVMIGHGTYSTTYEMKAVEGYDNLYSVNIGEVNSGNTWGGATQLGFMAADAIWGGEANGSSSQPKERIKWAPMYSGIYNISSTLSGNVLFTGKDALSITKDYKLPAKAPVITIGAAPEFATTTVGETSTVTVTYTVENSEEKPEISLDNDAFTAEDAGGTITITFAPTEAKEYTATLTLTIGEVTASVELAATAKAEDAPIVPEILNLAAGEIAEVFAGGTTEFEVTYTLLNAEEATVSIEGEGFTIKKQDKGTATIEFAPTEAKTYEAVVTVTSGDVNKTLEISATAKKVPVVITISFVNPDKWTEAAFFAWGAEGLPSTWPGELMNQDENGNFTYQLTLPENGTYNFIINNNGNGLQSVDMTGVTESTCYNLGAKSGEKYNLVVSENCEYAPAPEPEPIDPYVAIRGTMTNWDVANDIKMTYNADAANGPEWYITAFEVPADGKFKVVSVDAQSQATWYGSDKVDLQEGITNAGQGDGDIALPAGKYDIYFKVNEGRIWIQKYVAPEEPKPSLTVSAEEVVFDELTLGDEPVSATATITYTIENSDETAVVALESEVFEAIDEDGTITITFAPEAEGEYTAQLTITLGEIVKTIAISGSAKDAEIIEPEKPELIVSTEEVVFETLILDGEQFSSTETITYKIKNSDEAAVIALESEVFKAEDENGTITITFTPTFRNASYKATLTITLGDIVKTVAISAVVKPLIDDLIYPGFDDTKVGEYEEIEMLYSLHKGNEGEARIDDDEAFKITSQKVGQIFIRFTPLEAKEYTATLIITSGKFEREITLIANGIAPDPEPTDITFTVQVPEGTKECYIAGTSDDKDLAWKFIQMEKVDGEENLFSITVEKTVLDGKQWKYASGADWAYVEFREGDANRTKAEEPYDVVTSWKKLYDPDFQPIDPYYAIRGLNGDASWTGSGDIKLEESADGSEWSALGFTVAEGESFKVIYIDENAKVSGYYADLEEGCKVGQTYDDKGNLVLPAGTYDLYFKSVSKLMWISKVDTPTDVEDASAELIYAVDGTIIAPAPFAIIDLAGKDVTKANGSLQGTYIVKTLNSTAKISVK